LANSNSGMDMKHEVNTGHKKCVAMWGQIWFLITFMFCPKPAFQAVGVPLANVPRALLKTPPEYSVGANNAGDAEEEATVVHHTMVRVTPGESLMKIATT
jgi:hypothetical protein